MSKFHAVKNAVVSYVGRKVGVFAALLFAFALMAQPAAAQTVTGLTVDWDEIKDGIFTNASTAITAGALVGGAILAVMIGWRLLKRMAAA